MKIYTRTGDAGETGLFGVNSRVAKDSARVEAYGTVDELNCVLGAARAALPPASPLDTLLARLQGELFDLGAELATPAERLDAKAVAAHVHVATDERTAALEDGDGADFPPAHQRSEGVVAKPWRFVEQAQGHLVADIEIGESMAEPQIIGIDDIEPESEGTGIINRFAVGISGGHREPARVSLIQLHLE